MIDALIGTSRTFACARQLHKTLTAATWTPHPTTNEAPLVVFAGVNTDQAYETVIIEGTSDDGSINWGAMNPPVLNEEFDLFVEISTEVPGSDNTVDGTDAFARLEELCGILQQALRDPNTGQPTGGFTPRDGNGCYAWAHSVTRFTWLIEPTQEGWIGTARVGVHFNTRF